ncbi:MAG TPA: replication-relaxation family protein [Candidatus Saccharimonadales bacterium]|nr:replication-relaxation family protein [Candidatus Saccharimonadales bacterium]
MDLPHITTRQQALLRLLYRHRFLERKQIQTFLHHANKGRSSAWLRDLRAKQYIDWLYDADDPIEKNTAAIYYLSINGIRYLRSLGIYPPTELRKRYAESTRSRAYVERCLLLANCCLNMEARTAADTNVSYMYSTEADYANPDNTYHFVAESESIHPQLCYTKRQGADNNAVATHSLLEVIDPTLPRYSLKKRLKNYVEFLDSDEWEDEMEAAGVDLPVVLIACPDKATLIYAKRYTRKLLRDTYGDEIDDTPDDIHIRFATVERIKKLGITERIWEEVTV